MVLTMSATHQVPLKQSFSKICNGLNMQAEKLKFQANKKVTIGESHFPKPHKKEQFFHDILFDITNSFFSIYFANIWSCMQDHAPVLLYSVERSSIILSVSFLQLLYLLIIGGTYYCIATSSFSYIPGYYLSGVHRYFPCSFLSFLVLMDVYL